ncbi:MAG: heavy-metal-associated domain-containing protein [Chloroflexota bacterium]
MQTKSFDVPALYGDHHTSDVRRILLGLPGVTDVYASSAFRIVEVTFDEKKISDKELHAKLTDAGYLGEWPFYQEDGKAIGEDGGDRQVMRHSASYEQTKQVVGFAQRIAYQGRPLWPCPGIGPIKGIEED